MALIPQNISMVRTLTDLKAVAVGSISTVFMLGRVTSGDGLGGFYDWNETSTDAEDTQFLNTVVSNNSATGRWIRVYQKAKTVPQGILVSNGGVKTLYVSTVTDSNGKAKINLTTDNTPTGPSIFTEIWENRSYSKLTATGPGDAVQSYLVAADLKTTTHGYYKANAITITLGLVVPPLASTGAGIAVGFKIEGI